MILDMCCGSRMFWFQKESQDVVYADIRSEMITLTDREICVKPDVVLDFRSLPFPDNTFEMVVFDPPHLTRAGPTSFLRHKYGVLTEETWPRDLAYGFNEAFRVLLPGGFLIFKWNETHIPTKKIIGLSGKTPLFGHPSGKRANTHWLVFQKEQN